MRKRQFCVGIQVVLLSGLVLAPCARSQVASCTLYGHEWFGFAVSGAGDVNGDGFDDVVLGNPSFRYSTGSARVLSGRDGSILYAFYGDSIQDQFGYSVSDAGDVDGDGFADIIVGANRLTGDGGKLNYARVFSGKTGAIIHNFKSVLWYAGTFYGSSVSGAGDVDGDGHDDVIVGARYASLGLTHCGMVEVYSGKHGGKLYEFFGDSAHALFGSSVSGAGDVNNDGYGDFVVGAWGWSGADAQMGLARVFSGKNGAVLHDFHGQKGDQYGRCVSGAGDVNQDGFDDIICFASSTKVEVRSGKDGSKLHTLHGKEEHYFGLSVSGAGDVNQDGYADLIVGAPYFKTGSKSGKVRVYSGLDGSVLYKIFGETGYGGLGRSVSSAGDLNNDGHPDFILGSTAPGSAQVCFSGITTGDSEFEVYGSGLAGYLNHTPALGGAYFPAAGGPASISVANGLGGATGIVCVGFAPAELPFYGGLLHVTPVAYLPHVLNGPAGMAGYGWFTLPFQIPGSPAYQGLDVYFQALYLDAAAVEGKSVTNGLKMHID